MKILSASQIRQWDEYTILNEPISSLDLMERAAAKCTDWLLQKFDNTTAAKIFCGKGNNGGDGLAIAPKPHSRRAQRCQREDVVNSVFHFCDAMFDLSKLPKNLAGLAWTIA